MVVTDPEAAPHKRASMLIVPTDTPGYELRPSGVGDGPCRAAADIARSITGTAKCR